MARRGEVPGVPGGPPLALYIHPTHQGAAKLHALTPGGSLAWGDFGETEMSYNGADIIVISDYSDGTQNRSISLSLRRLSPQIKSEGTKAHGAQ